MSKKITITHKQLKTAIQNIIFENTMVEFVNQKLAYYQLKAAHDYFVNSDDGYAPVPVVVSGIVRGAIQEDDLFLPFAIIVDVVQYFVEYNGEFIGVSLNETEDESTAFVNIVDVIFLDQEDDLTVTTEAFNPRIIPSRKNVGISDLASEYIIHNMAEYTSQFPRALNFSVINNAVEELSEIIVDKFQKLPKS